VLPSPYGWGGINPAYGFGSRREKEAMNDQTGKLLVVDSDDDLRANLITVLGDAGYVVSTDDHEGMKAFLAFEPDTVVLGDESAAAGLLRPSDAP
jgi:hypothetical protein